MFCKILNKLCLKTYTYAIYVCLSIYRCLSIYIEHKLNTKKVIVNELNDFNRMKLGGGGTMLNNKNVCVCICTGVYMI